METQLYKYKLIYLREKKSSEVHILMGKDKLEYRAANEVEVGNWIWQKKDEIHFGVVTQTYNGLGAGSHLNIFI